MKYLLIIALMLGMAGGVAHAGWTVASGHINYSTKPEEGFATFEEALKETADKGWIASLEGINLSWMMKDGDFQKDLTGALERDSPREWKEALKSAGNMHNPKMIQLWGPFKKAVLATTLVRKMNAALAPYGLACSDVSMEELELRKEEGGGRVFYGFLWVMVTKIPAK